MLESIQEYTGLLLELILKILDSLQFFFFIKFSFGILPDGFGFAPKKIGGRAP
jgi:hypothetical protein